MIYHCLSSLYRTQADRRSFYYRSSHGRRWIRITRDQVISALVSRRAPTSLKTGGLSAPAHGEPRRPPALKQRAVYRPSTECWAGITNIGGELPSARTMPEHTSARLRVTSCGHGEVYFVARHLITVAAIEICLRRDIDAPCVDRDSLRMKA